MPGVLYYPYIFVKMSVSKVTLRAVKNEKVKLLPVTNETYNYCF